MGDAAPLEVRLIAPEDTWEIRAAVLWPEKTPGPDCELPSDRSEGAFHVGAFSAGTLVSVGSFSEQSHPDLASGLAYRLRAMGTSGSGRGLGAGTAVVERALSELQRRNAAFLWCDARHAAVGFYARIGFEITGPSYRVPKRGLHRMAWRSI